MGIELVHFSDCGAFRKTNQDAYLVRIASACCGNIAMAAVCDGMGGLKCGETASAAVVSALSQWFDYELPQIITSQEINSDMLFGSWGRYIAGVHTILKTYGKTHGVDLGTTLSLLLMTETHYYLAQVGDSRIYLDNTLTVSRLTRDQTFAEREYLAGRISKAEYIDHPGQHMLLQCIGNRDVVPVYTEGIIPQKGAFLICSDGFYHHLDLEQLHAALNTSGGRDVLKANLVALGDQARTKGEKDNMTVAALRWDGFGDMPARTALLMDPAEEDFAPETLVSITYASALPQDFLLGTTDEKQ